MPFSRLYRREPPLADADDYDLNMPYNPDRWHEQELDFTSYPPLSQTTDLQAFSKPTPMDTDDSQPTYLRPTALSKPSIDSPASTEMFNTGPFGFPELNIMESNTVSPLDISSSSSVRSSSVAGFEAPGHSPSFRAASATALPTLQEKMCPLISGDIDTCEPSKCGPDAPCMNFTNLPPIEECANIPCITPPDEIEDPSQSPPTTRQSTRLRRPLVTKRSMTTMSSSSTEDRKPVMPPTRRPAPVNRANTAPERPGLTKMDKKQRAKQAHSLVEKKYRENLNTKLSLLYTTLQNAQYGPRRYADADSDLDLDDEFDANVDGAPTMPSSRKCSAANNAGPPSKFRKSEVLDDAMAYVNQTEVEMRHMEHELLRMSERVKALEKLVKCEDCSLLKRMVHMQVAT